MLGSAAPGCPVAARKAVAGLASAVPGAGLGAGPELIWSAPSPSRVSRMIRRFGDDLGFSSGMSASPRGLENPAGRRGHFSSMVQST